MKSFIEAIKEGLRVVVLGVVSYLLTVGVIDNLIHTYLGTRIDLSAQVIIVGAATSVLRGIDAWLHETGKMEKGLTRF